jgi:hypothetical protein
MRLKIKLKKQPLGTSTDDDRFTAGVRCCWDPTIIKEKNDVQK